MFEFLEIHQENNPIHDLPRFLKHTKEVWPKIDSAIMRSAHDVWKDSKTLHPTISSPTFRHKRSKWGTAK